MARLATPLDARAIAQVHIRSWQGAYRHVFPDAFLDGLDLVQREEWWTRSLLRGATALVAERDDAVVGFSSIGPSDEEGWGEVFAIYALPEYWGAGVGHELMGAAELWLAGGGHRRALLWVLDDNPRARKFYERQGWVRAKRIRIENIGGIDVTEVRYEKDPLAGP